MRKIELVNWVRAAIMDEREEIKQKIAQVEAQRATLGDATADAALDGLRQKMATLAQAPGAPLADAAAPPRPGERRLATVLFCDVTGSTALAEKMDAEEWAQIMNRAFEHLIEPVNRYGGNVSRLLGDAVLAFFGLPAAHEDDPERAVRAGLAMLDSLAPFRDDLARQRGLDFNIRIGINTGLVVAGEIGSELHGEYTAMGDAVNLAARMEQTAAPGTLQIAEETYRQVHTLFDFESLGAIAVKGKAEPVPAYRVLGARAEPGRRRGLESHGISSPLIGRDKELAAAQGAIERLMTGEGGILSILGEAGIGKSRLLAELRHGLDHPPATDYQSPITWLEGHTLSYAQTISYWPFQEILRQYAAISDEDSEQQAWDKFEGRLRALFPDDVAEILPYLASLLALAVSEEYADRVRHLDGEALGRQLYRATRRFFERLARERPLLLVFDDLHWLDRSSAALLEHLLPLVERVPLLICGLSRPDPDTPAGRLRQLALTEYAGRYTEVTLAPLSAGDSGHLIHNLLEIADLPAHVRALMVAKADGNPFYLEEILRDLIEAGAIVHDAAGGRWRATRQIENVKLPDTIQGLIIARIDRLDDDLKRVLRRAAVIGRSFLYRVLSRVLQEERLLEEKAQLDRQLDELRATDLVREIKRLPELEYIFKHALAQAAAYESILIRERRALHGRVAAAIEALFGERLEEFYGLLAYHYSAAEDWPNAQKYLLKAGDQAGGMAADAEALAHYSQAITAYGRAFGDEWDPLERASLERKMGEALFRQGDHQQARLYLERALALLGHSFPDSRWGVRLAILAALLTQTAHRLLPRLFVRPVNPDPDPALREYYLARYSLGWIEATTDVERFLLGGLRLLNIGERAGYVDCIVYGAGSLSLMADTIGYPGLSDLYHRQSVAYLTDVDEADEATLLSNRAIHFISLAELEQSLAHAQQGVERARQAGDLHALGNAMFWVTNNLYLQGKLKEALANSRNVIRLGEESSDMQLAGWGHLSQGNTLLRLGRLDEGLASLQQAAALAEAVPDYPTWASSGGYVGRAYAARGDLEQALAAVAASERIVATHGAAWGAAAYVSTALADVYTTAAAQAAGADRAGWLRKADRASRQAERQARRSHRPLLPLALLLRGRVEWLRGRRAAAEKWWRRGLAQAQTAGQRYDEAALRLELGRRLDDPEQRRRAEEILSELGAPSDKVMAG